MDTFRPITMANFKFKLISKILEDRIASIMHFFISKEQKWFIRGRNIKDGIYLESKAINLLEKESFGGNKAIKEDVCMAFDTMNWGLSQSVVQFWFQSEVL